jgi:hypothetical protein
MTFFIKQVGSESSKNEKKNNNKIFQRGFVVYIHMFILCVIFS